ncbi:hypothetical protein [Microvirga sp. 17 mud 1-3]|uniref:hypothetical protein n=1 Tax=Microvirga sp. 17 mud 1-3 TaxID=2082949 RepID=UPI001AECB0EB|nr:hypothetical protein [Microvirga sp. 17 mud 1-3]
MFYSASTGGFYSKEIHGSNIPADAVEITDDEHAALMAGQAAGKRIVPDENGRPILADPPPAPPSIPKRVTRRQGRLALLDAGLLDAVESAIDAITDPTEKRAAQIEYEAETWERGNAFLMGMWAQIGGTDADLDALFVAANAK